MANPDNTGKIGSVTMGIGERILSGETPELFYSNGQIVYKIKDKDDLILLLDPRTGIVRDVSTTVCGAYCYHNQITNNRIELAQNLTSSDPNVLPDWQDSISEVSISLGTIASLLGTVVSEGKTIVTAELVSPLLLPLLPLNVLDALKPGSIAEAERNGRFNSTTYLLPLMSQYWGDSGPSQWFWDMLNEGLKQAVDDLSPKNDYEYMAKASFVSIDTGAPSYLFTTTSYGGNDTAEYGWLHTNCHRNPNNNGYYVVECDMTYISEAKHIPKHNIGL